MNTFTDQTADAEQAAWNQAHDRLQDFLNAFALGDHAQVSRLTLKLLDQARDQQRRDPSLDPLSVVMTQAQKLTEEWFASNLEMQNQPASQLFSSGCIALLLSRAFRAAPEAFLTSPLPQSLKETMHRTLLVTGPDLKISSMTPRPLDYGPMLGFAKRTWHRWNIREIIIALLFWTGVYFIFYWWLSEAL
jgi:hypothetical protein